MKKSTFDERKVSGTFVTLDQERYYLIANVDQMEPFFVSLVSDSDHWLFIASNGGLTAGRVSPETALFPYVTVDKIYNSVPHTGSKTLIRARLADQLYQWEPFNREHDDHYALTRNLYKNVLGDKLLFEEINHDLQLVFRYRWATSAEFGFVRDCELENLAPSPCQIELLDGLQNLLPAGTPRFTQTNSSYLVDAYKWTELDADTGLAMFTLFSAITDRAEPCESLRANTTACLGLTDINVLLSTEQLRRFRHDGGVTQETHKRGLRGCYLVNASLELAPRSSQHWRFIANIEQSQAAVVQLQHDLTAPGELWDAISASVASGSDALARVLAASDGFQLTGEEIVSAHHYANVLFNTLRGGIFDRNYQIDSSRFMQHVQQFNSGVSERQHSFLAGLPGELNCMQLLEKVQEHGDPQLERLAYEYLPITFGRRHGDPSRPWNQFAITLQNEHGQRLLTYQGNWRDIFQNWEALLFSYPAFTENVIAKFVNATTPEGYNPYRITNEGIDWEVDDPDDPWSYIGYWGDHQIIYLQKLLEFSRQLHPGRLEALLRRSLFSYANVPYKISPLESLLADPKNTISYDLELAARIEQRVSALGSDGKLMLNAVGDVHQVNLIEKWLVPLLGKLGNLVVDGGIWLNTQRPEWNDANNALVGQGLSMVTLYYLRRYICFGQQLLNGQSAPVELSVEVNHWLQETADALGAMRWPANGDAITPQQRFDLLLNLGQAASRYRQTIYQQGCFGDAVSVNVDTITTLLDRALLAIDHSIPSNLGDDGLYHAYNLLKLKASAVEVGTLYPMLEGQVAVLSSGAVAPQDAVKILDAMFASDLFRPDQQSFILYPDRALPGFLEKNVVPEAAVASLPVLQAMLTQGDRRVIERDAGGMYRFNAELTNIGALNARLEELAPAYPETLADSSTALQALYEHVFNHQAFTGRSGGMFGFEGLGSIYWHMVSKLLLAVQECYFAAVESKTDAATCNRLADFYYRVRAGLGFNKTPQEYGAFPADPYSHTPGHIGAQQPGMTGQVKEEILARFGELGVRIVGGSVRFTPGLLRRQEFTTEPLQFRHLDTQGQWRELEVPSSGLAYTWCQVPLLYQLRESAAPSLTVHWLNGEHTTLPALELPQNIASELLQRTGKICRIELTLTREMLFKAH
jgi:hypothetical protein|tara:strand:+ start:4850 stop:8302 length:3453 start_codon:yes stop_codon:yes gene_type:complete